MYIIFFGGEEWMKALILLGKCLRQLGDCMASPAAYNRNKKIREFKKREEQLSKVKDTVYYIIKVDAEAIGLAAIIRGVTSQILYAKQREWIPVVDMQSNKNPYLDKSVVGKENSWEYYFEQPTGIGLGDVVNSNNVIYSIENQTEQAPTDDVEFFTDPYKINFWRNFYKENIRLNRETQEYIEVKEKELFNTDGGRVLGVVCRGTDYIQGRPYRHPVQPLPEDVINEAKKLLETGEYKKIFLATEDIKILEMFKSEFGEKLIYVEQQRYGKVDKQLAMMEDFAKESSPREEGLKYLTAIYLMAKCDAIIGGRCGMTVISYLASDGYKYEKLWNLGRYGIDEYCMPSKYLEGEYK